MSGGTRDALPAKPRILIVGAGVLGTVYGVKLSTAGHDVSVLERSPSRIAALRASGLVIEPLGGGAREVATASVLTELGPGDRFDLAIVIARKTHLASILEALGPTDIPTVLFMVSNADGPDAITDRIGKRAALGFPGAGGRLVDDVVRYSIPPSFMQSTMLGEPDGTMTARLSSLQRLFASAGFSAKISTDMDAWLKSHEAFVSATGNATYVAGSGAALAADRDLLTLNIRAIREIHTAMDAAGIPVTPSWFRLWQRLPMRVIRSTYSRFIGSQAWDDLGTDQLRSMRDEVEVVTEELRAFGARNATPTPALDELVERRNRSTGVSHG